MRPNLINRLKEEWNNLDPVDPLRGLLSDAIDALAKSRSDVEQPAQPAQQEPVAEVKAKMTGGNVGIATVIHEIYSPLREPLQPGDKLYAAYRWVGWDVEQVWSERIFGIDMRFENVQDATAFRKKLDEAVTPPAQRTWVGLTHEEIDYQAKKDDHAVYFALGALWAEAKLKEKNNG